MYHRKVRFRKTGWAGGDGGNRPTYWMGWFALSPTAHPTLNSVYLITSHKTKTTIPITARIFPADFHTNGTLKFMFAYEAFSR